MSVVGMCVHVNRCGVSCVWCVQSGHAGDVCSCGLLVQSWDNVLCVCLFSVLSVLCMSGASVFLSLLCVSVLL